jgi:hypothetical protein
MGVPRTFAILRSPDHNVSQRSHQSALKTKQLRQNEINTVSEIESKIKRTKYLKVVMGGPTYLFDMCKEPGE